VKRPLTTALAVLVTYVLAITVTPIPIEGAEDIASQMVGRGSYVVQLIWAIYTFFGLIALILKIVYGTWIEENRILRTVFNVSIAAGIVGIFLPWLIVAFAPQFGDLACVLRGWVGMVLNAFC